jgi:magnesium transporter
MDLRQSLASGFAARYPHEAAAALETRPPDEIAQVLQDLPRDAAAAVLIRLSPGASARAVERLDAVATAGILAELEVKDTLIVIRRVLPEVRDRIIQAMPAERADVLNSALRFPADTAGALMDPRVAALPVDMVADEALKAVRHEAEHAHDVLYVVDRNRGLAGAVTLQALLRAHPKDRLDSIMQGVLHRLHPSADRHALARHPGWRDGHSLPVVDRGGRLMGAVQYSETKKYQDELYGPVTGSGETTRALGDLFWTGVGGVIDALTAAVAPPPRRVGERTTPPTPGEQQSDTSARQRATQNDGEE